MKEQEGNTQKMRKKTLKKMERKLFVKKTERELSKSKKGNTEKRKETLK